MIILLMAAAFLAPCWLRAPQMQENRVLAERPAWPKSPGELRAFVKAADAYVADRFPIRPHLIGVLNRARLLVGVSGSPRVIVGRHGWLFYNDDTLLGATRNDPPVRPEDARIWLRNLAGRTETLRARGVPYVVVSPPIKDALYPEFAPDWYPGASPKRPATLLTRLAREAGAGEVLYLDAPLIEAKRRGWKVFSRHDTHWTALGAYAGYAALMNRLHALGLADPPLPLSAFGDMAPADVDGPRDLAKMLGVASLVHLDHPHLDHPAGWTKATKHFLTDSRYWTSPHFIDTGSTGKPILLMTRDSFSNELIPFLFPHFSRIILVHNQNGVWRPDLIERFKPDLVILEVLEAGLGGSMNVAPEPSPEAAARIDQAVKAMKRGALRTQMARTDPKIIDALGRAEAVSTCNIETAALAAGRSGSAVLALSGWFALPDARWTPSKAWVRLEGVGQDYAAQLAVNESRRDVVTFFKDPRLEWSGFDSEFRVSGLPKGAYTLTLYRRSLLGWTACRAGQALQLL